MTLETSHSVYEQILHDYCSSGSEDALYRAQLLSQDFIAAGVPPDEIVELHSSAVQSVCEPHDARAIVAAQQLLLEVMIAYGVKYSEYAEIRLSEAESNVESEQQRAEQAERLEKERLELFATITHELGTPLTVVKGNVAAIRRLLIENVVAQELEGRAADAEVATDRLLALRNTLLHAARNEPVELATAPMNIESAIRRAVNWAQPEALAKNVTIEAQLESVRPYVTGEPDALQSILGNLLSNGIRYTPEGGSMTVKTFDDDDHVIVEVSDTGIGLTEATKARLFERFFRGEEARAVEGSGLGLGLSLARDLVLALDGTISAEGAPGEGTRFTLRFPRVEVEEEV